MQAGLFLLMAVSKESSNQMDNKIRRATMTRMLNLRDVLELVNDGFDDGSFARASVYLKDA